MPGLNYSVVIRDFRDRALKDFSPGGNIAFVDNPTNLAWTEYMNEVGEAFFTISQDDPKAALLADEELIALRPHMEIWRDTQKVWAGWIGEVDETETDIIFYAYSYISGMYDLVTPFNKKYTGQTIGFMITDVLNEGKNDNTSRVHWITNGTIQNPVTTSDGATDIILPLYRAPYKRRLTVFRELTAYAISDTTNHVIFEITPDGIFNYWKNRKATVSNVKASFQYGDIRSFRRIRRPVHRRSNLKAVGTSPTDVNLNQSSTNVALRADLGLSQEAVYFAFVRDADELKRITNLRLARAGRVDSDLYVSFHRNKVVPFRAPGSHYQIGDLLTVTIQKGASLVADTKVVVGQQVIYSRLSENVRLLLADQLSGVS